MAKIVDITEKLSFDTNPALLIKGERFEVNADAQTVLLIMGDYSNKTSTAAAISAYERMFSEADRAKIMEMKLPFKDLMNIIEAAIDIITGTEETGKDQTHTTT